DYYCGSYRSGSTFIF
nr:immunoglobulin light chain junction region [Macaca mulatta]MOV94780.1 immunoglobulin light chain junction region [Macaca mulatta]MOW66496.1 immunoglobulin light chain junction region [Macaca mulatta]MOW67060.1 immunoglobulin light chain junction region [Macaca mulatta]MOW67198.1 immunoglobulin light chain junction region [Macaca mulatta]